MNRLNKLIHQQKSKIHNDYIYKQYLNPSKIGRRNKLYKKVKL